MANIHWTTGIDGFFQNPLSWSTGTVPGAGDNAIIDAPGTYTVVSKSGVLGLLLGGTQTVGGIQTSSNAKLQITGDIDALDLLAGNTTLRAINGTGGGANAGTIVVQDAVFVVPILGTLLGASATLEIGGVFNNTGLISLNGQPHLLGLLDADQTTYLRAVGATTLTGGGRVTLSDVPLNVIDGSAGAVLTNVNNTISGSGYIEHVGFVNDAAGIVDANQSRVLIVGATAVATNRGLFEGTSRSGLVVACTVDNTSGGLIEGNGGGRVSLEDGTVVGGTVGTVGKSVFIANVRGSVLDGRTETMTILGAVTIAAGSNLTIEGAFNNTGKIVVSSTLSHPDLTDLIVGADGATLTGGGELVMTQRIENRVFGVSGSATLTNVDNRITGGGLLGNGVMTLVNEAAGVIVGNATAGLVINTGNNTIDNAGAINASHGSTVKIVSAINNSGRLESEGGTLLVSGAVSGTGEAFIVGGTIDFTSTFTQNVVFGSTGTLELAHSRTYTGTVFQFSKTGATALDLADIAFNGSTKATYAGTASAGTLTVTNGAQTAHIALRGDYLGSTFHVSSDGHGGTKVVDPTAAASVSAHRFVAAAAALGSGAGAGVSVSHAGWQARAPMMLARPAIMNA